MVIVGIFKCTCRGECHKCYQSCFKVELFQYLMNGSTVHRKEKEGTYIHLIQREEFMKGGNPCVPLLLNLPDMLVLLDLLI